jgi:hypothetical protein
LTKRKSWSESREARGFRCHWTNGQVGAIAATSTFITRAKGDNINLGVVRIVGSLPAKAAINVFKMRLEEFGIDISKHIVGITDGASLMMKVGKDISVNHVTCLAHGIHLPSSI